MTMLPFINFREAIINLSHFTYAIIENKVTEKKDTTWRLRVHMSNNNGFTLDYDTEREAQEAYNELCEILMRVSQTEAIK